jgi:protein-disulfide isomerase
VTIIVLTDLECPACAGFHATVEEVLDERPDDVRVVYVDHPLQYHRFALQAARGAACAAEVGAYRSWIDVVFQKRDSLGLKSWGSYAVEAGITDSGRVERCMRGDEPMPRISAALEFGEAIGITGVPTVLVNGWRYPRTPTTTGLNAIIDDLLVGERPS